MSLFESAVSRRRHVRTIHGSLVVMAAAAGIALLPETTGAQTVISADRVIDAEQFVIDPVAHLVISDPANNPLVTFSNNAGTEGINFLYVGRNADEKGRLQITSGSVVTTATAYVGQEAGTTGSVVVTGAGSAWNTSGVDSTVGAITIGNIGTGSLTIEQGGKVTHNVASPTTSLIGSNGGASGIGNGTVLVTGAGSTWETTGGISVAQSGNGTLTIQDGGLVRSFRGTIGGSNASVQGGYGQVLITGAGSTWEVTGTTSPFQLGNGLAFASAHRSTGLLNIENGGTLSTAYNSSIGIYNGTTAHVVVTGEGSKWLSAGNIYLSATASGGATTSTGSLTIENGGLVDVAGTTSIVGSNATLNLRAGGTLRTANFGLADGAFNFTGGTLELNGGNSTVGIAVPVGGTLTGTGAVVGHLGNAGTLAPGHSPGTLAVTGDLNNTGTIEFEIAGLSNFDFLDIDGAFSAGGNISLVLLNDYVPELNDSFTLASFGSFVDAGYAFNFDDALLPGGLSWDTTQFSTDGAVTVVPEPTQLSLLGLAGAALASRLRRRRSGVEA